MVRLSYSLLHLNSCGSLVGEIGVVPGSEGLVAPGVPNILGDGRLLKKTKFALGPREVYVATGDKFEVLAFRTDGSSPALLSRPFEPIPVTDADIERWLPPTLAAATRERLPAGHTLPAILAILVGDDGSLWVEEYRRDEAGAGTWWVFDDQRQLASRVEMPAGFRPMDIGRDFVVGVWRDNLDVEHVLLYRLEREMR